MARASTYTLLPLDIWAKIMGISPWEFNQFKFPGPKSAQCADVMYQFPWQKDHLGREEIAEAIANAEQMLADQLMYWPAPKYIVDEVVQYPRPGRRELWGFAGTPRGDWKSVQLQWHRVISGGVFNRTFLNNTTSIVLSDSDSDSITDRFTATVTVPAGTLASEIALYFTAADRDNDDLAETWRIRPVKVTVVGTTATIIGHLTLLVKPNLTFAVDVQQLDSTDTNNYVTELECYRVFTDTQDSESYPYQGVAIWDDIPGCTYGCTFSLKALCLREHDNDQGVVSPTFGPPCDWPYPTREPDRLEVNYVAGLPLLNGEMAPEMAKVVAYLAACLLANEKCGCDRSNRIMTYWRERITSFTDGRNGAQATGYTKDFNDIPFPVTRGGLYAWQRVKTWRDLETASL